MDHYVHTDGHKFAKMNRSTRLHEKYYTSGWENFDSENMVI